MQKQEPKTVSGQIKNPPFHSGKWDRKRHCLLLTELCYYDTEPSLISGGSFVLYSIFLYISLV